MASLTPSKRSIDALVAGAAGAVPPTGGVPPEDAPASGRSEPSVSSLADEVADGLELLLRAMRSMAGTADPELEAAAQRTQQRLQQLGEQSGPQPFPAAVVGTAEIQPLLAEVAHEFGAEIGELVRRLVQRIDAV
jgi:hypothetical protein